MTFPRTFRQTVKGVSYLLAAAVFIVPLTCLQANAETPESVMKEILGKIKAESNSSPIVEYVDWETAFAQAPDQQKQVMNINSPEQLKEFYREVLKNPAAMMKKHVESRMATVPEDQKAMMQATMVQMEQVIKQKEEEMKQKIAGTEYTIGEAVVTGSEAVVPLTATFEEEEKKHDVDFIKKDGRWLLATPGFAVDSKAPPKPGSAPVPAPMTP